APYPVASIRPCSTHGAGLGCSATKYRSSAISTARSSSGVKPSGTSIFRPSSVSNTRSPRCSVVAARWLHCDVAVLAGGHRLALGRQHPQRLDQSRPRFRWLDHVVDEPALGGCVRRRELVAVLGDQLGAPAGRVVGLVDL